MTWRAVGPNWVFLPSYPVAIIHFLGGAFVGAAPQLSYGKLLEQLAAEGYVIIATPFLNTLDHRAIAHTVLQQFEQALNHLQMRQLLQPHLPIYGLGHSLGCKLHLLIGSFFDVDRAGNMLMAFNNFTVDRAIPLADWLDKAWSVEFTPTPDQTYQLIRKYYLTKENLLIRFQNDDLDQTKPIAAILGDRFPDGLTIRRLQGNHLTPLGQNWQWQSNGSFSPLDALGQWVKQEVYRDHDGLAKSLLSWLET